MQERSDNVSLVYMRNACHKGRQRVMIDQLYFADKDTADGSSELYSISEFSTRTTDNIRKGYLVGKYGATPDIELEEVE